MAPHQDPDDERPAGGPPLPPDDRLWRHPSELGPVDVPPPGSAPSPIGAASAFAATGEPIRQTSTRAALTGACLAGALVTLGMLLLTRPLPDGDLRRAPALRRVGSAVTTTIALSAPAAAAADPIHRAQAVPLANPTNRPGRLDVQVADDGTPAIVVTVEVDGPAHRAGLSEGDRIVAVNDVPVHDAAGLSEALATTAPGETATVAVHRDGVELLVPVVLG